MKRYDYSRTTPVKPLFSTPSGRFVYYDEAQTEINELKKFIYELYQSEFCTFTPEQEHMIGDIITGKGE